MKNAFLFLFIFGQSALALQETESNSKKAFATAIILPAPMLPNAETYQFIDAVKPGDVLFSITRESGLHASNAFKDFFVVCFQAARYEDAFYFVPESMKADAEKALSIYEKTRPGFYAHLVVVSDNAKFWDLASKTSAGAAGKDGKWYEDVKWYSHDLEKVFSEGYLMLPKERIKAAMAIPSQNSDPRFAKWCCGINSGARASAILEEKQDYYNLVENCPRTVNRECMAHGGDVTTGVGAGLLVVGTILAPFTFGASLIPGAVMTGIGVGTSISAESISSDVGPNPQVLSEYLSKHMQKYRAFYSGYNHNTNDPSYNPQGAYERSIVSDIRGGIYPRIVLIISGTFSMHYVTIIGVLPSKYSGLVFDEAVIMDTDGTIAVISALKLAHWTNSDGYANWILDAKFNMVEFSQK